jgi:hypothetical protein
VNQASNSNDDSVQQSENQETNRPHSKSFTKPNTTRANSTRPILDIYDIIKQQFIKRSEKQLGLMSFFARVYSNDKCGSNGLPLTPNSIRIYGKFQFLKTLAHKNLCKYVDIKRGNNERLFVITEHYTLNLNDLLNDTYIYNLIIANTSILVKWIHQMLRAFLYLGAHSITHRYLHLKCICVTPSGDIKLSNYGLFYMTEHGYCVNFPVANLATLAPECLLMEFIYSNKFADNPTNNNEQNIELNDPKADVWAFGVILFQFLFGLSSQTESTQQHFNELLSPERLINNALDLLKRELFNSDSLNESSGYNYMISLYGIDEIKRKDNERRIHPTFIQLIKKCLTVNSNKRPTFNGLYELLERSFANTVEFRDLFRRLNSKTRTSSIISKKALSVEEYGQLSNDQGEFESSDNSDSSDESDSDDCEESLETVKWRLFNSRTRSGRLLANRQLHSNILNRGHELNHKRKLRKRMKVKQREMLKNSDEGASSLNSGMKTSVDKDVGHNKNENEYEDEDEDENVDKVQEDNDDRGEIGKEDREEEEQEEEQERDYLWKRGINEVYYLWQLAGGDCMQTLKQNGLLTSKLTPVHKLPVLSTVEDGCEYGKPINDETIFDDVIVALSLQQLRNRLNSIKLEAYYPIIEQDADDEYVSEIIRRSNQADGQSTPTSAQTQTFQMPFESNNDEILKISDNFSSPNGSLATSTSSSSLLLGKIQNFTYDMLESTKTQPLNIKESDIEYQFHRIIIFSRYLLGYPFKKKELYEQCRIDIPPIYRGHAWATLLDVGFDINETYAKINKEAITSTDRQIDVDIPRCHQYDVLMASPQAHYKLKRVLKAWVISHPHLVYWQGLDSLCAPFLYLNFNNESVAYGCLSNFVNKYAAKFFLKDNSFVIHEYLAVFSHLIAFHDPELATHFDTIEFKPDLYAIPWFLTMFAHVFPLYKIFHLWDTLLLGSSSFPLCIGVAILKQLRNILLNADFNECILLFSELPEISIEKCVTDSLNIFYWTPSSCLYRQHSVSPLLKEPVTESIDELEMAPIEIEALRAELCPRISGNDLIKLLDSTKQSKLIVFDLRSSTEYANEFILTSKSVPYENLNMPKLFQLSMTQTPLISANESDSTAYLAYLLQQNKNYLKVVCTSLTRFADSIELANALVKLKYTKVCILNRGVECLKSTSIFNKQI